LSIAALAAIAFSTIASIRHCLTALPCARVAELPPPLRRD
jgi:hypothetical protein